MKNKIAIHLSLWTPEWTSPFVQYIPKAANLGFDAVEIPLMTPGSLPVEQVRDAIMENEVDVFCGTGLGADMDISSEDSRVRQRGEAHIRNCLKIAARLGSPGLGGVIHSCWGKKEPPYDTGYRESAQVLKRLSDFAGEIGVFIALELINRYESSFLNSVDQGLDFLEQINRPNAGLHLDTFHMNIEETDICKAIEKAGSKLFHLHFSENHRGFPGSGSLPWEEIAKTLGKVKYSGIWGIESFVTPGTQAAKDVGIWRKLEKDTEQQLKKSLDFLRGLIA